MKKLVLSLAVIAFMLASCGEKKSNNHSHEGEEAHEHAPKTHQHEDGSVHEEHQDAEHHQEEFMVKTDDILDFTSEQKSSKVYTLLKNNCISCHSISNVAHNEIIAPPLVAIKQVYGLHYKTKESFVNAVVKFSINPQEKNVIMKTALKDFKLMPKDTFNSNDLQLIAEFIYNNEIPKPKWFESHFKEEVEQGKLTKENTDNNHEHNHKGGHQH